MLVGGRPFAMPMHASSCLCVGRVCLDRFTPPARPHLVEFEWFRRGPGASPISRAPGAQRGLGSVSSLGSASSGRLFSNTTNYLAGEAVLTTLSLPLSLGLAFLIYRFIEMPSYASEKGSPTSLFLASRLRKFKAGPNIASLPVMATEVNCLESGIRESEMIVPSTPGSARSHWR